MASHIFIKHQIIKSFVLTISPWFDEANLHWILINLYWISIELMKQLHWICESKKYIPKKDIKDNKHTKMHMLPYQ